MFYAKFKEIDSELTAFETEAERDAWTGFQDDYSKLVDETPESAVFQRVAVTREQAEKIIAAQVFTTTVDDTYNDGQKWIIYNGFAV